MSADDDDGRNWRPMVVGEDESMRAHAALTQAVLDATSRLQAEGRQRPNVVLIEEPMLSALHEAAKAIDAIREPVHAFSWTGALRRERRVMTRNQRKRDRQRRRR